MKALHIPTILLHIIVQLTLKATERNTIPSCSVHALSVLICLASVSMCRLSFIIYTTVMLCY